MLERIPAREQAAQRKSEAFEHLQPEFEASFRFVQEVHGQRRFAAFPVAETVRYLHARGRRLGSALCFILNLIARRNRCHFPEQVDHRAVAGGGQLNGTLYRSRINGGPSHPVEYFKPCVDLRMLLCPAPLDLHTEATHQASAFCAGWR